MSCINFNLVETRFNNHHNTYAVNSKECLSEIYNGNGTKAWALCYFASTSYLLHHSFPFGDPGPHGDLFGDLGPHWVPILCFGSPFSSILD